jgi:hypothetical protein
MNTSRAGLMLLFCLWQILLLPAIAQNEVRVLFFSNPMSSDNEVIRRTNSTSLSMAERHFLEASKGIFQVTFTQDGKEVTAAKLRDFKMVVFFTAINPPGVDKEGLLEWIKNGGAFVGIHSTANTYQDYPAFGEMLGANFDRRPWRTAQAPRTKATVRVLDSNHASTRHLPKSFQVMDDLYQFKNFDVEKVQLLLALDVSSLDLGEPKVNKLDQHFPISWAKSYGKGRVFYTALGDWEETWTDPLYRKHLVEGIRWAGKLTH